MHSSATRRRAPGSRASLAMVSLCVVSIATAGRPLQASRPSPSVCSLARRGVALRERWGSVEPSGFKFESDWSVGDGRQGWSNWLISDRLMLGQYPGAQPAKVGPSVADGRKHLQLLLTAAAVDCFACVQAEVPPQDDASSWVDTAAQGFVHYLPTALEIGQTGERTRTRTRNRTRTRTWTRTRTRTRTRHRTRSLTRTRTLTRRAGFREVPALPHSRGDGTERWAWREERAAACAARPDALALRGWRPGHLPALVGRVRPRGPRRCKPAVATPARPGGGCVARVGAAPCQ